MAALTFYACNVIRQFFDLSCIFVRSGFSISKSLNYIKNKRNSYLFLKYCREQWLESHYNELVKKCNFEAAKNLNGVIKQSSSNIDFDERLLSLLPIYLQQREVKNRNSRFSGKDLVDSKSICESTKLDAHMSTEVDFTAMESSADDWENVEQQSVVSEYYGDYDDITVISGEEVSTFHDYIDTVPLFANNDLGDIHEGLSFTISGYILLNCERFSINLILGTSSRDVALHINPRLPQNYIVRNSKVKGIWGREEVSSALPFSLHRGSKFTIQILVSNECYMISVNGNHFAEYKHRLPYKSVSSIEVKGDIDSVTFGKCEATSYPDRLPESQAKEIRLCIDEIDPVNNGTSIQIDETEYPSEWKKIAMSGVTNAKGLSLPFYGRFPPRSLGPGKCLKFEGRVKMLPQSFYINLQTGQNIWPHPVVAFHFNPRFAKHGGGIGKHVVCRNSWYNGKWGDEERTHLDTNFCPGKSFSMAIVCCDQLYEVHVNGKLITEFRYRVPPETIDTVYVQGDIKLWDVVLASSATVINCNKSIYQNPAYQDEF